MKQIIAVVDGMGGGIGTQIIGRLKDIAGKDAEIIALGTNSTATERMVKAGAGRGATGENAIRVSIKTAAFILGPVGIVLPNALMGEITPAMAEAILAAPGERILIPLQHEHFYLAGLEQLPLAKMLEKAIEFFQERTRLSAHKYENTAF
jgi:hypothetical protein